MSDLNAWAAQQKAVAAAGFRFIAYTQRYYGTDPWPDAGENFNEASQASDLQGFIRALNLGPVHLVAWSNGGPLALLTAIEAPELVKSLVLYEPRVDTLPPDTAAGREQLQALFNDLGPAIQALSANDVEKGLELFIDALWMQPGTWAALPEPVRESVRLQARTLGIPYGTATITCDMVDDIDVPVLAMSGERTFPWMATIADAAADCIDGAEHKVLAGATHMAPIQSAAEFNVVLVEFLTRHRG